jgi:cytidylate kinase
MMALSFTLLAFGLWNIRQPILSGIAACLALLSGPAIIVGGLGLILAWLSLKLFRLSKSAQHPGAESSGKNPETNITPGKEGNKTAQFFRTDSGQFLVSAVAAIIVIGTLFLIYPQGLSAWFEGIPEYLQGWTTLPSIPPGRLAAALLVYQPFAVLFALIAILLLFSKPVSGGKSNRVAIHFAAAWSIFAFLLILMYPNRQVADTVWVLVPIWIMAGFALTKLLSLKISHPISMALAIFLIVLSGLFWFTLASITQFSTNLTETNLRVAILIGILALGILAAILVALGWSWDVSRSGLVIGVCTAFGLYLISVMWGASQLRFNSSRELWTPIPAPGQAVLFDKVLGELSSWNSGFGNYIDVLSIVEVPSLHWELRNFPEARFIKQPETSELPSVIITLEGEELPAFSAAYRGEDFVWWTSPGWMGALPPDVVNWLVFRKAPIQKERIIMWARGDLFPGGTLEAEPAPEETLGKKLADELGYLFFDTGVMYRAVTWAAVQRGVDIENERVITDLSEKIDIDVRPPSVRDGRNYDILIDGVDVTWDIRRPLVDSNVSQVSAFAGVRKALSAHQRRIGLRGDVVMVGRDIGTIVLPEADLKLFLDASVEERARRRFEEIQKRGDHVEYDTVLATIQRRDQIDSTRDIAPLKPADDAIILNSDNMDAEQVQILVVEILEKQSS